MLMRGRRTQNGRQAMEPKANTKRRKMTLTEHLAQREARRKASGQTPSPSIMSADKIAELEALGTCDCPACRAIRLSIKRQQGDTN